VALGPVRSIGQLADATAIGYLKGASPGPFDGHLHDVVDGNNVAVSHQFKGHVTDICAALS